VRLSRVLWCLVSLRTLASLSENDDLVHIFLALNYVFVCTGD
jgi:hypothetical protein